MLPLLLQVAACVALVVAVARLVAASALAAVPAELRVALLARVRVAAEADAAVREDLAAPVVIILRFRGLQLAVGNAVVALPVVVPALVVAGLRAAPLLDRAPVLAAHRVGEALA